MTIETHRAKPAPSTVAEAGHPAGARLPAQPRSWFDAPAGTAPDRYGHPHVGPGPYEPGPFQPGHYEYGLHRDSLHGAGPGEPPGRGPDGRAAAGALPSSRRRSLVTGAAVIVLAAGGGAGGAVLAGRLKEPQPAVVTARTVDVGAVTGTGADSLAGVAAAVTPSIVTVFVDGAEQDTSDQAGSAAGGDGTTIGSGVVLSADGLVLTNNHVIDSGGTLSVRLSDGRTVPARLVAADDTHDLALVQAAGLTGLTPATFGGDSSVAVGDTVLAFGSPLGLEGTVTAGIVSAVDRSIDTDGGSLDHLVQTDAPINAGNSGGALVDTGGRVVGINVAIATAGQDGGSIGVGFAVPADTVTAVVRELQAERD